MRKIILFLFIACASFAQQFQMNDPNPASAPITEINFQVHRFYPIFSVSDKPISNDKIIRLTSVDGDYKTYLFFTEKYNTPRYNLRSKTLTLFYPESYYDYIHLRLEKDDAFIVYREYKDGHKWGEIYFDKFP